MNAQAELVERMRAGGTRDEVSAMVAEKGLLKYFADAQQRAAEHDHYKQLKKELQETQRLLKTQTGGSAISFENPPDIPREELPEPH